MTSLEIEKIIARIGKETYKMIFDYAFSLGYKKGFDDGVWTAEGEEEMKFYSDDNRKIAYQNVIDKLHKL